MRAYVYDCKRSRREMGYYRYYAPGAKSPVPIRKVVAGRFRSMPKSLLKAGYPPIDIKFSDRVAYYNTGVDPVL